MMYLVYQHIFPNGKRYIGVTRNSAERRWGYNGYNYKSQVVGCAIKKYGWENIEHDIFCICETKESAERIERWLIKHYNTTDPMFGYNVLPGGDVGVNDATPEMRYKLGNGNRGKHLSDEHKKKISEGCKRKFNRPESNGCVGKKASETTREKMRESHKNDAKAVACYTKAGEFVEMFRTINEASMWLGSNAHTCAISRCCRGVPKYKTVKGYVWKYIDG